MEPQLEAHGGVWHPCCITKVHHDTSPVTMDVEVQRRDGEKVKVPSVLHDLVRSADESRLQLAAADNHTQALEVVAQLDREA